MKVIDTIPELVETLGGYSRVAQWAGYEDARGVHNWVSRGVPPAYHLRLILEARQKGFVISPEVFGLDGGEAEALRSVFRERRLERSARA